MNISITAMIQGCLKVMVLYAWFHQLFHQVLEVGRRYYGCRDLPFVPLENGDGVTRYSKH